MALSPTQGIKIRKSIRFAFEIARNDIDGGDFSKRAEHTKEIFAVVLSRYAKRFDVGRVHLLDGRPLQPLHEEHRYEVENFWGWEVIEETIDEVVGQFSLIARQDYGPDLVVEVISLLVDELNQTFGVDKTGAPNLVFRSIKDEAGDDLYDVPKWERAGLRLVGGAACSVA